MNCLWLTRQDPRPADSGELLYSIGLIRSLAEAGTNITVLTHASNKAIVPRDRIESAGENHEIRWKFVPRRFRARPASLCSPLPSDSFRHSSLGMRTALRSLLKEERWDYVIIDHAAMGWTLDEIRRSSTRLRPAPSILYLSHNHEATTRKIVARSFDGNIAMRSLLHLDASKYAALEENLCAQADLISAITLSDTKTFQSAWPKKPITTLTPGFSGETSQTLRIDESTPRTVLFLGSFQWVAKRMNLLRFIDAAASIFPRENIRLQIVGKADLDFVRNVVEDRDWVQFAANPPVLDSFFERARIGIIAEESGGGFKLKALDYLFHRLPIAAFAENVRDLRFSSGVDYLGASDAGELVRTIAENIDRYDRLNDIADQAIGNHAHRYDWGERGETLLEAMEDARYGLEPVEYNLAASA